MGSMKVHHLARALWEHDPSPSLGCKRLRPLAPKLPSSPTTPFDLKTFIRPESGPRKLSDDPPRDPPQVETHPGGTRWNPTQEQIGILEMLYRGGMRTPNAQQIEQITAQLARYGKIEGKNVFYWFQNHKARERQKQKRNSLRLSHSPRSTTTSAITFDATLGEVVGTEGDSPYKKKCRGWTFEGFQEQSESCNKEQQHTTLELFPLHPEGR
ncbi:hypothetical protein K1719_021888 [Acacia pycnantha]|nr:hypothetical protein K1719_021888 [Acacia pycnantha]